MLHSLKKKTVGRTAHSVSEPSEYTEAKARLTAIRRTLHTAVGRVDAIDANWGHVVRDAQLFHQQLSDGYPHNDHVKTLLRGAEEHMETLHGEYTTKVDPAASHRNVIRNVKAYLGEIDVMEKEYTRVADAKREFEMYNSKVESLDKHHKEGEKKSRNLDKLESSRVAYDTTLRSTMNQMNTIIKKAPSMYSAVYVAYWLAQSRYNKMIDTHFKPSILYAERHEMSSTIAPPSIVEKTAVQKKVSGGSV